MNTHKKPPDSEGDPDSHTLGIGSVGGAIAGGTIGSILGPTGTLCVGLLGLVIGEEYERRLFKQSPTIDTYIAKSEKYTNEKTSEEDISTEVESDVDRVTVRIKQNIGRILAVDSREYNLQQGDVVELPVVNTIPLLTKDAAEIIPDNQNKHDENEDNSEKDINSNDGRTSEETMSEDSAALSEIDDLVQIRDKEREQDSLVNIQDSFYTDASNFLETLRAESDKKTKSGKKLNNKDPVIAVKKAEKVTEDIFEQRLEKVVKLASFAATDVVNSHIEELTTQERLVYEHIRDNIKRVQKSFLETISKGEAYESDKNLEDNAQNAFDSDKKIQLDIKKLQSIHSKERRQKPLVDLHDSFYSEVGTLLKNKREKRDEIAKEVDDPFSSSKVRKLTDEIDTIEETVEALFERRVGKIVMRVSSGSIDMSVESGSLTTREEELYNEITAYLETIKNLVLSDIYDRSKPGDAIMPGDLKLSSFSDHISESEV